MTRLLSHIAHILPKKAWFFSLILLCVSSCSDYDNGYDAQDIKYPYDFARWFGNIASDQNWNMATGITVDLSELNAPEGSVLEVYSDHPVYAESNKLARLELDGQTTMFDAQKNLKMVYTILHKDSIIIDCGYHNIRDGRLDMSSVKQTITYNENVVNTRASQRKAIYNSSDGLQLDYKYNSYYYIDNASLLISASTEKVRPSWNYSDNKNKILFNPEKSDNKLFLHTSSDAVIDMSLVFRAAGNGCQLGYVYYKDGESIENIKRSTHYILTQQDYKKGTEDITATYRYVLTNIWQSEDLFKDINTTIVKEVSVTGRRYRLKYFDDNGTASDIFPAGYNIIFFIRFFEANNYMTNPNSTNKLSYTVYSLPDLNTGNNAGRFATWNVDGMAFFGFEDEGDMKKNSDYDEYVCCLEPKYITNTEVVSKAGSVFVAPICAPQPYVIACEDMGGEVDVDFNDVVFAVQNYKEPHWMTESYNYLALNATVPSSVGASTDNPVKIESNNFLLITPLAAGGKLSSYICRNNREIAEIHEMFGQEYRRQSGKNLFINTTQGAEYINGIPYVIELGEEDFHISNNMGGFYLAVGKDGEYKYSAACSTVTPSEMGSEPKMIVIPDINWKWPLECVWIKDAYPGFSAWSSDSQNINWINYGVSGKVYEPTLQAE